MRTQAGTAGALAEIVLDASDLQPSRPDSAKIAAAVRAIAEDGAVIVVNAVDPVLLEVLAARMDEDLQKVLRRPERAENFAPGHLQQDPPPESDFLWPSVLAHPFVLSVCRQVLRQPLHFTSYSNNTNLPGSQDQAVHVDEGQLWPGLDRAHPTARLTVNIPLSTVDADSGAIELWPGTHLDPRVCRFAAKPRDALTLALEYVRAARLAAVASAPNRRVGLTVPKPLLDEQRVQRPPVRAVTCQGDLIIRDPRLWHRGTANRGSTRRFMLALDYDPEWRECPEPMQFPPVARDLFEAADMTACATYLDGPIDYLSRHRPRESSLLKRAVADRNRTETY